MYRLFLLLNIVPEYFSLRPDEVTSAEYEIKLQHKVWFSTVTPQDL
jgi:hypothetical protein